VHQFTSSIVVLPLPTDRTVNTVPNDSYVVVSVPVAAETCLPRPCLAMGISGSTISAFRRQVTFVLTWGHYERHISDLFCVVTDNIFCSCIIRKEMGMLCRNW
jgi:hypothetical protein